MVAHIDSERRFLFRAKMLQSTQKKEAKWKNSSGMTEKSLKLCETSENGSQNFSANFDFNGC
jgi:hypothetical protein